METQTTIIPNNLSNKHTINDRLMRQSNIQSIQRMTLSSKRKTTEKLKKRRNKDLVVCENVEK